MRYVFLTTGCLNRNSSFVRLRELGRCLSLRGVSVYYLCDDTPYNQSLVDILDFAEVVFVPSSKHGQQRLRLTQVIRRRSKLNQINADIVHFLNPSPNNTATIIGSTGLIIADWDELLSRRILSRIHRAANRVCEFYALRHSSLIVVASKHLQQYFQDKFGVAPLYLPYATYLGDLNSTSNPFVRPTAVYLGNFHHDSDHDLLIDAWTILEKQNIAPDLQLIGGGSHLDNVREVVEMRRLSSITVSGYLPWETVWNCLKHAHILLFPIRDTIGNRMRCPSKTFAYMQAGRPIVTNRVGEVVEALGKKAYYVEPTSDGFASAVRQLFQQKQSEIVHDLERHSWESRADLLLRKVKDLID